MLQELAAAAKKDEWPPRVGTPLRPRGSIGDLDRPPSGDSERTRTPVERGPDMPPSPRHDSFGMTLSLEEDQPPTDRVLTPVNRFRPEFPRNPLDATLPTSSPFRWELPPPPVSPPKPRPRDDAQLTELGPDPGFGSLPAPPGVAPPADVTLGPTGSPLQTQSLPSVPGSMPFPPAPTAAPTREPLWRPGVESLSTDELRAELERRERRPSGAGISVPAPPSSLPLAAQVQASLTSQSPLRGSPPRAPMPPPAAAPTAPPPDSPPESPARPTRAKSGRGRMAERMNRRGGQGPI